MLLLGAISEVVHSIAVPFLPIEAGRRLHARRFIDASAIVVFGREKRIAQFRESG